MYSSPSSASADRSYSVTLSRSFLPNTSEKHQPIMSPVSDGGSEATTLAPAALGNALLQQGAAEPGVDRRGAVEVGAQHLEA
jgi:hypothetical protein